MGAEIVGLPAPVEVLVTAAPGAVLLCRRLARAVLQVWELDDDEVHAAEAAVRDLSEQLVRTAPAASRLRLVLAFAWPLLTAEAGIVGGASVVEYVDVTGRVLVARGAR